MMGTALALWCQCVVMKLNPLLRSNEPPCGYFFDLFTLTKSNAPEFNMYNSLRKIKEATKNSNFIFLYLCEESSIKNENSFG